MNAKDVLSKIAPCNMEQPYIFVSYAGVDYETVWQDVLYLQSKGYNIWLDEKNLDKTKASWKEDAIEAVKDMDCQFLIFYVSRYSLSSRNCFAELSAGESEEAMAMHSGKPLRYITIDVEDIGDITKFRETVDGEIHNSIDDKQTKQSKLKTVHTFMTKVFDSNNERVRIHPKNEQNRKSDYYADILACLPDKCKNRVKTLLTELESEPPIIVLESNAPIVTPEISVEPVEEPLTNTPEVQTEVIAEPVTQNASHFDESPTDEGSDSGANNEQETILEGDSVEILPLVSEHTQQIGQHRQLSEQADEQSQSYSVEDSKPLDDSKTDVTEKQSSATEPLSLDNSRQLIDEFLHSRALQQKKKQHFGDSIPNGRLAEDNTDMLHTQNPTGDDLYLANLEMPDHTIFQFNLLDVLNVNSLTYLIASRATGKNSVLFFVFKFPLQEGMLPVYIRGGRNKLRAYRAFVDKHRTEFSFMDYQDVQPRIQEATPKTFKSSAACNLYGRGLPYEVKIPSKYQIIDSNAFGFVSKKCLHNMVLDIVIPNSVFTIENFAFSDIMAKRKIVVPDSVTHIGFGAFCLGCDAYIECSENSYAYRYAKENHLRNSVDTEREIRAERRKANVCQYCGDKFWRKFFKDTVCQSCGKPKDY